MAGLQEVPIPADPYDEQIIFFTPGYGYAFRVAYRQHLTVGKMDLEGAERSPVPHLSN